MRILVVSNLYPPVVRGGYEVECSGVVARLRERHEVLVLTSSLEAGTAPQDPTVVRALEFLHHDKRSSLRAPLASVRAAKTMRETLAAFRPDMAWVWNGAAIPQAALRVLADSGTPVAYRVCEHWFGRLFVADQFMRHLRRESSPTHHPARRIWDAFARGVNRNPALRLDPDRRTPAAISWNSETIRRLAGVPPAVEPVLERVIHSTSTRVPLFSAIERRPDPERVIAFMGRLERRKGAWIAVRALGRLRDEHGIDARLVIAGPGDEAEQEDLRREAREAGVEDRVELTGPLDGDGLAALLARAHALVIPSDWEDPFPLVCIEGAVARVPIVAADIGGIPECLHDEEHALLHPPGDFVACAGALARVFSDPVETAARVDRALARGLEFAWEPYLDASERFVEDAAAALGVRGSEGAHASSG